MKPKLIDLGYCIARIKYSNPPSNTYPIVEIIQPSSNDEHFGYEPPQHITIGGRPILEEFAQEIMNFLKED